MNTPIHDFLRDYEKSGILRCHMPGGKGENHPFDITEIYGADSLYESGGIILESERNAASLFGAGATLYSCGGSTLCIQAMLAAAKELTGKSMVAAGRYSHKSLVNACALLGLKIRWLYPDEFLGADIPPDEAERAIDGETAAVFINSVDYLGGESDISQIAAVCHKKGVLLLVDNAHGAYKALTGEHPITLGADMTADSAHKTLPALTGAAYLHLKNPAHRPAAKSAMALFGSSSPSYLIMDSLDLCNRFLAEEKERAHEALEAVSRLKKALGGHGFSLRKSDALRVTIDAAAYGYGGREFARELRERGAECEMSGERYVVLLFSVCQKPGELSRLEEMLSEIPKKPPIEVPEHKILRPEAAADVREALFAPKKRVKTRDAEGKICAEISSPCPPCVPLVMPGERLDKDCVGELLRYGVEELSVLRGSFAGQEQ